MSHDRAVEPAVLPARPTAVTPALGSLEEQVRALSPARQRTVIERVGARIDPAMRIDATVQLARAIVNLPEARDSELLGAEARAVLRAVASAGGVLEVDELPAAAGELTARGLLFESKCASGVRLCL